MLDLGPLVRETLARRATVPASEAVLVAVSGIDGSGKGYATARLLDELRGRGLNPAGVAIDGWLNLPHVRFDAARPAEHFYEHGLRFGEMFERLVLPLKRSRSVRVEADFTEETATAYRRHVYEHADVDVVVLEGIFLLRRDLRRHYDLSAWIDCTFETALDRAVARAQEGLPPAETVRAYRTIYFPAQEHHFRLDAPRAAADLIVPNDPRLERPASRPG